MEAHAGASGAGPDREAAAPPRQSRWPAHAHEWETCSCGRRTRAPPSRLCSRRPSGCGVDGRRMHMNGRHVRVANGHELRCRRPSGCAVDGRRMPMNGRHVRVANDDEPRCRRPSGCAVDGRRMHMKWETRSCGKPSRAPLSTAQRLCSRRPAHAHEMGHMFVWQTITSPAVDGPAAVQSTAGVGDTFVWQTITSSAVDGPAAVQSTAGACT